MPLPMPDGDASATYHVSLTISPLSFELATWLLKLKDVWSLPREYYESYAIPGTCAYRLTIYPASASSQLESPGLVIIMRTYLKFWWVIRASFRWRAPPHMADVFKFYRFQQLLFFTSLNAAPGRDHASIYQRCRCRCFSLSLMICSDFIYSLSFSLFSSTRRSRWSCFNGFDFQNI